MFQKVAGVQLTHVPYSGAAPSVQDLVAGQIDGVFDNPPTVISHIQAGTIRALALAVKSRLSVLPNVPTSAEAGLPGFEVLTSVVRRRSGLHAGGNHRPAARGDCEVAEQPAMQERFGKLGARLVGNSPAEFRAQIASDRARWGEVLKRQA